VQCAKSHTGLARDKPEKEAMCLVKKYSFRFARRRKQINTTPIGPANQASYLVETASYVALLDRYRRRLAKGFKRCLHLLVEDVGVDHRSGEVCMTEDLLHQADLARLTMKVRSKGVAQGMR